MKLLNLNIFELKCLNSQIQNLNFQNKFTKHKLWIVNEKYYAS